MSDNGTRGPQADATTMKFLAGGGEMGALIRAHDWSETALGAVSAWPQSLKTAVRIMLTSRQPIWIGWGNELIYLYNDAYQSIIGGKHPWALGRPTREVWSEIWPNIGPMLATAMGGVEGTYVEEQLLIMERNGYPEETYYTFSYSPIPDDDGSPGGIICANTEDTFRVIGERQLVVLRELAARTGEARTWAEACERGIAALAGNPYDLTFGVLYMLEPDGSEATRIDSFHMPEDAAIAPVHLPVQASSLWPIAEVLQDHETRVITLPSSVQAGAWERPTTHAAVLAISASGDTGRAGVLIVGLSPFRLFDEDYKSFLGLAAGQIAAALANASAYEEERRRAAALAELDRAKTDFFSNVSHEFRTPLTLMLGPLEEILHDDEVPQQSRQQIALAHRNGTRLLRLVNSLLDFTRIEAGRAQARFQQTDLGKLSADIASSFRSAIEKAGLTFEIDARPLPQPVFVDHEMWEKILLNLISNAFKFTHSGTISVAVEPGGDATHATLRVSDTGIGIEAAELPKLFDRFHRVAGAAGRSFEGSGIGLALVRELVKLHGGEIQAESVVGAGTTFTITLPYGRAHLPSEQVVLGTEQAATPARTSFVDEAMRWLPDASAADAGEVYADAADTVPPAINGEGNGKRVLLADDNADMRQYVRRLLEAQGYTVEAVGDGEAALASLFRETAPDLILTDVMMPKLDGFGLLRAIRNDKATAGIPVVMLSARAGEEAKVDGLDAGADDYLIKPFAARELLARVNVNIQMAEIRREANRAIFLSEQRLLMSQDRLSRALATGRVSVYDWRVDADIVSLEGPLAAVFGVDPSNAAAGLPIDVFLRGIHPDDLDATRIAIQHTVDTGEVFQHEYRTNGGGDIRSILTRGEIVTRPDGERVFSGVLIDLTREKEAERALALERIALEEQTQTLSALNRTASAMAGDLDLERLVQTITDAAVEVTGAEFGAFFYNIAEPAGDAYMLYTLSGAPAEAFASFPKPRITELFAPTFTGASIVRSDDITKDPRYGINPPNEGMPVGHLPVRSYLAVPVRSRGGDVLGGLLFGHSAVGVFDQRAEERVTALVGQAAVAMDNAKLFQEAQGEIAQRRKAEEELQSLNASLEERVIEEIAERMKTEEALRQAQKMESIGQLTGGVAHDFNNLLTIIIGGLETIRRSAPNDGARRERAIDMALKGAQRAANLTSRLLAFSRRQPLDPKPLELNIVVRDMTDLLHRTLGEQIELEGVLTPRLWTVEVDQNQLESAIINLAVNARDAMPDGGKLTIETSNAMLDESYAAVDAEVVPGQYAVISVSDSGSGISKETLAKVFEPFFTTKEVGRGTGLGLSMVYGFVKQSGGHVTIYSEVDQGTTVKLYFPRYRGNASENLEVLSLTAPHSSAGEVVLLVEDNDDVRTYSAMILTELGYQVLEAGDADAGLAIVNSDRRIDLLFTDVVLPGKSGKVLADAALQIRPNLKVLFTTGYSRNAIVHHGRLDAGVHLISKPFTFEQLAARVRDILDKL